MGDGVMGDWSGIDLSIVDMTSNVADMLRLRVCCASPDPTRNFSPRILLTSTLECARFVV